MTVFTVIFFKKLFIYFLFILGSTGSFLLHILFLQLWCVGFSLQWFLLLQSRGSRVHRLQQLQCLGSVVGAHGLCCPMVCRIFPDQGQNPCLLQWECGFLTTNNLLLVVEILHFHLCNFICAPNLEHKQDYQLYNYTKDDLLMQNNWLIISRSLCIMNRQLSCR